MHPYNINIYPKEYKWIERFHTIQSSSLTFLREHTFDFNKWIDSGINWLSLEQYDLVSTRLLTAFEENFAKPKTNDGQNKVVLSDQDNAWISGIYQIIEDWLTRIEQGTEETPKFLTFDNTHVRNSYQRLLLYQELPRKYPNLTVMGDKVAATGERVVKVLNLTPEEHAADIENRRNELKKELSEAFGFGHVFKAMINAKKPILGHNMFLDLAICFHQFYKPLPEDSNDFVRELHSIMPLIMDNKTIASKHEDLNGLAFETTALGDLANLVLARFPQDQDMPKITIPADFKRYKLPSRPSISHNASGDSQDTKTENSAAEDDATDSAYHEAGFDALQTGVVYLNVRAFYYTGALACDPLPLVGNDDSSQTTSPVPEITPRPKREIPHPLLPSDAHVSSLMNSLNLMQIAGTFNLDRPHSMPDRRNMFILSNLTSLDKTSHINDMFAPMGNFKISWIDISSCVLTFIDVYNSKTEAKILNAPRTRKGCQWQLQKMTDLDSSSGVRRNNNRFNRTTKTSLLSSPAFAFAAGAVVAAFATIGAFSWLNSKNARKSKRWNKLAFEPQLELSWSASWFLNL